MRSIPDHVLFAIILIDLTTSRSERRIIDFKLVDSFHDYNTSPSLSQLVKSRVCYEGFKEVQIQYKYYINLSSSSEVQLQYKYYIDLSSDVLSILMKIKVQNKK